MTVHDKIADAQAAAVASIEQVDDLESLIALEPSLFGKKSELSSLKRLMGKVEEEERAGVGQALNEAQRIVRAAHAVARERFLTASRRVQLEAERLDLSESLESTVRGNLHLVTQTMERLEDVFVGMGFTVSEGPQAETDWYNFEALNLPAAHPARSMFDTLYLDLGDRTEIGDGEGGEATNILLRTHTSPVQIRVMEALKPPIYTVCPGRVFRRDTADASHMPVFHQIEGLVVDHEISLADLAGTLNEFTAAYFGGSIRSRLRPSYFPFTEPSAEFDITCVICEGAGCQTCQRTGWIELGGCGMVHPNVLANCGIDSEEWTGFAFGFGIDRLAIMRYGIKDLRDMYTNDIRFLRQF
ncbi:MAG: phenylalanine--tRNA ligase subunit alpha [Actinomycetota bacterium]|nr:phenylalanine--tRNA ligase subunit alpha [Acidimicrobiales bacterium]MED5173318.1 phenylalanine--tRNA ligase subunit alpha [Actinomycetota bacterium]